MKNAALKCQVHFFDYFVAIVNHLSNHVILVLRYKFEFGIEAFYLEERQS
ncbi:hypothetical protein V144x_08810 [Gimesia aquarii]|uniref:Uncharacterized protein n=1 Tax=Gimesia aquarii TaxID=2527964 RepID=A0A517VQZ0_9PLAN|nr:hypothetical protein V144x_08810 [Gimesia aquarii]